MGCTQMSILLSRQPTLNHATPSYFVKAALLGLRSHQGLLPRQGTRVWVSLSRMPNVCKKCGQWFEGPHSFGHLVYYLSPDGVVYQHHDLPYKKVPIIIYQGPRVYIRIEEHNGPLRSYNSRWIYGLKSCFSLINHTDHRCHLTWA